MGVKHSRVATSILSILGCGGRALKKADDDDDDVIHDSRANTSNINVEVVSEEDNNIKERAEAAHQLPQILSDDVMSNSCSPGFVFSNNSSWDLNDEEFLAEIKDMEKMYNAEFFNPGNEFFEEWAVDLRLNMSLFFSKEEKDKWIYSCCTRIQRDKDTFIFRRVKLGELATLEPFMEFEEIEGISSTHVNVQYENCAAHCSNIIFGTRTKKVIAWIPSEGPAIYQLPNLPEKSPFMVELDGNLYAFFFETLWHKSSLHVLGAAEWLELPQPPDFGFNPQICPAVVGTKLLLFVFEFGKEIKRKVFCFDPAKKDVKGGGWRQLPAPSFCFELPLIGQARALVLNESNMNIMFFFDLKHGRIGVHTLDDDIMSSSDDDNLMSSDTGKELVKPIAYFKLPDMGGYCLPKIGEFIHLGDRKVCFVGTLVKLNSMGDYYHVVVPFEFEIDISKKNFTLNFGCPKISQSYSVQYIDTGCFML